MRINNDSPQWLYDIIASIAYKNEGGAPKLSNAALYCREISEFYKVHIFVEPEPIDEPQNFYNIWKPVMKIGLEHLGEIEWREVTEIECFLIPSPQHLEMYTYVVLFFDVDYLDWFACITAPSRVELHKSLSRW